MESTPKIHQNTSDSGIGSFDCSLIFGSTPKESTPISNSGSRKRKRFFEAQSARRKLENVLEYCQTPPPFSSTLNESLSNQFDNIHIQTEDVEERLFKKVCSTPSTPEKQIKPREETLRRPSSYVKYYLQESPLKEARDLLYPNLKPLRPVRKIQSPLKLRDGFDKFQSPAKKCLFSTSQRDSFKKVLNNTLIMTKIFSYLSNGDLYRVSMVSKGFYNALQRSPKVFERFSDYRTTHKKNKENYRITPPNSPEKPTEYAVPSQSNRNFKYFYEVGRSLSRDQSLNKCVRCGRAAIVEQQLAQCTSASCGHIRCLRCDSFAATPDSFRDGCKRSALALTDLSNDSALGLVTFNSSKLETSQTTPATSRKQKECFSSPAVERRVLSVSNCSSRQKIARPAVETPRRLSVVSLDYHDYERQSLEIMEPSSPPKVKAYAVCSKQSKRNLKRLTR